MKYIITGGHKLEGTIQVSGNKNSVLACMAAALLTDDEVILENVPKITDVDVFIEIFNTLGVKVEKEENKLVIAAKEIKIHYLPDDLVRKLRASILLVGPLLSRLGEISFVFPGGDLIGKRSIDDHLEGFKDLGFLVEFLVEYEKQSFKISKNGLENNNVFLRHASVTATENLIMASVFKKGEIRIRNAASEPHVIDLCLLLANMGANIEGVGTNELVIRGVKKLSGTKFRIGDDHIQIGTYAIAAALTKGKIKMICDPNTDLEPITKTLSKFGINFDKIHSGFVITSGKLISVEKVVTNIWPGFPTDLMSPTIVLATQSSGVTLCHDWMFEGRMFFTEKLISMGAKIEIVDPHRVYVSGPRDLIGKELDCSDIRAGMALVLAALIAKGESVINKVELIERGYEDVVENLKGLGAKISKI